MIENLPRLPNKKYSRCEHLIEGSQDTELVSLSIGDTKRVILCPLCARQLLGFAIDYLNQVYLNGIEFYKRHEEIENSVLKIIGKDE